MLNLLEKLEKILKPSDQEISDQKSQVEQFEDFLANNSLADLARLFGINFFADPWIWACTDLKDRMSQEEIKKLIDFRNKHNKELFYLLLQTSDTVNEEALDKIMMLWVFFMYSIQGNENYSSFDIEYGKYRINSEDYLKNNKESLNTFQIIMSILIFFKKIQKTVVDNQLFCSNVDKLGSMLSLLGKEISNIPQTSTSNIPPNKHPFTEFYSTANKAYDNLLQHKPAKNFVQSIIESAIKDLSGTGPKDSNGKESYLNIKLMLNLKLFGAFLKHLSNHDDWKELLGKFYFLVAEDKVLKRKVDQARLSKSVKKAFELIGAQYKKQIESKSAEIFKIAEEKCEEREKKLTQLLRHPQLGFYIGFLSGLELTSKARVCEVDHILWKFCNEALSKLTSLPPEFNDYEILCEELKYKFYEYTAFSVSIFNKSLMQLFLGTDVSYRERCDFIIGTYLDHLSELKEKLEKLKDASINANIEDKRRYFCLNAANYILENRHSDAAVIQKLLSEILDLYLSNKNTDQKKEYCNTFNELLLKVRVKFRDTSYPNMRSFIIAQAMRFLSNSESSWYDEKAFELVLKSERLNQTLQKDLIKKINKCNVNEAQSNKQRTSGFFSEVRNKFVGFFTRNTLKLPEPQTLTVSDSSIKVSQGKSMLWGTGKKTPTPNELNQLLNKGTAPENTMKSTPQPLTQEKSKQATYKIPNSQSASVSAQEVKQEVKEKVPDVNKADKSVNSSSQFPAATSTKKNKSTCDRRSLALGQGC